MSADEKCSRIVAPVDFSKESRESALLALELAALRKLDLLVLHVVHDPLDAPGFYNQVPDKKMEKIVRRLPEIAEELMAEFLNKTGVAKDAQEAGVKLTTRCDTGLPVETILRAAKSPKTCMLVMGSKGKTGLQQLLLGSVAEKIVRLSPVPVVINKVNRK